MPQAQRTPEGEQRWRETRERAKARAKKYFDRLIDHLNSGTLFLDEEDLVNHLTGFALDERKLEVHEKRQAAQMNQPDVTDEDQHFAELASAEMLQVPDGLRTNDLWLRFVAKGIARAREHWEGKKKPDPVAQEFKAQDAKDVSAPAYGCYAKAKVKNEPVFVLRAQDVSAPGLVFEWVRRNGATCPPEKLADALKIAQAMVRWPVNQKKAAD